LALKPTIYKLSISLSDIDKHFYDHLNLTVAQHPSETIERMFVRVLAYCKNASSGRLTFTAGLSKPDGPDIVEMDLQGGMVHWIDVGEPAFERIKKASRLAKTVSIYSFNRKSDTWWQQEQSSFNKLNININQFNWPQVQSLAGLVERKMELSITISEKTFFISGTTDNVEVSCIELQSIS
jgi:uncharacterized protein YaeQ